MAADLRQDVKAIRRLIAAGETPSAKAAAQRLVARHPDHPAANQIMCLSLVQARQPQQALYYARRAVAAEPGSGELLTNLGHCLLLAKQTDEAIEAYRRALEADPKLVFARVGIAEALVDAGSTQEAETHLREALTLDPACSKATRLLATSRLEKGFQDKAIALLRDGVRLDPRDLDLHTGLANTLNYAEGVAPETVFEAHVAFGRAVEQGITTMPAHARRSLEPERRLRIGFMSSDFRVHSCASYAEPLIEHLDRERFAVALYSTHSETDALTEVFKGITNLWRDISPLRDEEAAALIARDQIDILIELNGHTTGQRFGVMARRPAPLQGSYLGYPNTTGLRAIDFRIVDSKTDPPGRADALAVERLVRIDPSFLCYRVPREAAEVPPGPCLTNGFVTLGSFNALPKLTRRMIRVWSRAVREVPGARLVLKHYGMRDPEVSVDVSRRFAEEGMPEGRLEILPPHAGRATHLAAYARIDIGLDPFPYHGTTTTCEAFCMGVPVVTLAGDVHAARVGASLLETIGMPELIARDEDQYVRIVRDLAADHQRLASLRASMRERTLRSPLCDGPAFARRFGEAMRAEWRGYCTRAG